MRRIVTCAAAFLLIASLTPAYAKGTPGGGRPPTAGAKAKGPKMTTVKTTGPKSTAKPAKTTTTARGKSSAPGQVKKTSTTPQAGGGTAAKPAETAPNVPKNQKLQERLAGKIGGMSLEDAAAGFKNQGQFIAAVHAAERLEVPFQEFKAKMVDEGNSLGETIHFFKPEADADAEADIAESQASRDLK